MNILCSECVDFFKSLIKKRREGPVSILASQERQVEIARSKLRSDWWTAYLVVARY